MDNNYNLRGLKVSNTYPDTSHFDNTESYVSGGEISSTIYPHAFNVKITAPIVLKHENLIKSSIHFIQYRLWGGYYIMLMLNKEGVLRTLGCIDGVKTMKESDYPEKNYKPQIYFISTEEDNEIISGELSIYIHSKHINIPYIFTIWSDNIKPLRDNLLKSSIDVGLKVNDIHINDLDSYEGIPCSQNYKNATTQKPSLIYKTLMNSPDNSYVLFIDCDTMLYGNYAEWLILFNRLYAHNVDIVFQKDQSYPFNSGFQYIHNTANVRNFYKKVMDYFEKDHDYGNFTYDQEIMTVYLHHSGLSWCCADSRVIAGNPNGDYYKSEEVTNNALFYHTYGVSDKLFGVGNTPVKLEIMNSIKVRKNELAAKQAVCIFSKIS
jgi:hypothetical protein